MQVILKPMTHPELGEIIVQDDLFAIGRHEKPFSDYDPRYVEKLSRRHARIFEQDGVVYIADLGSLNGTTVNGEGVDSSPVRLQRGDEICFTAYLRYQIEILGASGNRAAEAVVPPPVQLLLTPEKQQDILEPIVVTQFPFLVNKASDVFAKYKDALPKEVAYISRRHAHIFLRGQDIFIEDLGSTNGTFVGGKRLEEHARKLEENDLVAFGGETFVYRVGLHLANEEATHKPQESDNPLTETGHAIEDPTRTTFVTSANSFLDIFCAEDDEQAEDGQQGDAQATPGSGGQGKSGKDNAAATSGRISRPRVMLHELKGAFFDQGDKRSTKTWLALIVLVGIVAGGVYYGTASKRQIRDLMEIEDYSAAAQEADRYLRTHADDQEIIDIATEAVLKDSVPAWLASVDKQAFDDARQMIERAKRQVESSPEAQQIFDALAWLTQLEQFISERGGPDEPLRLFTEESTINSLVDWWERDPKTHRRSLGTVSLHVPAFTDFRAESFSHLRTLQNHQSLSLAAIDRLLVQLNARLDNGDTSQSQELLINFERKYPRVSGVEALRNDLDKYQLLNEQLQARHWLKAQQLASLTVFETPVFQRRIELITEQELPTPLVVERYAGAESDWREGDTEAALKALESLSQERWGEVAERSLQRKHSLLSDFESLKQAQGKPGYDRRLLAFYRKLDLVQDVHFVSAIEAEFQVHSKKALDEAKRDIRLAQTAWQGYREKGGIRGQHRLEAGVSSSYRQRAALLSDAYLSMQRALEIYRLLKVSYPTELGRQFADIQNEVRLQRQSLTELEMVLEPALRNAKIELLPSLGETPAMDVTRSQSKE